MNFGTAQRCLALIAFAVVANIPCALAFDDQECAKIVPTSQKTSVDMRPNETVDMARLRAFDEVSRLAVAQVVGNEIQSARNDVTSVDNDQTSNQFRSAAQSSYRGLVRVKLNLVQEVGIEKKQLEIDADVSVCVPKPEKVVQLDREKAEHDRQPPRRVNPDQVAWFNPTTGEPQLWYWQDTDQNYEFYDKGGFQPTTGDPLLQVDHKFAADWRILVARKHREAEDQQAAAQREKARVEAIAEAERKMTAAQEEISTRVINECDRMAANPNDPRKPSSIPGVRWDDLKVGVQGAVENCTLAVERSPSEPRFRYQLARAYSVSDPKRAMVMFKRLADEKYPAAYDNLGWAFIDRRIGRNDFAGAVRAWQAGVNAGDSDAMTSVATFMLKGKIEQPNGNDGLALLQKAARLGNQEAIEAVQRLKDEAEHENTAHVQQQQQQQQQTYQDQQAARVFMGIVGGALSNIGR